MLHSRFTWQRYSYFYFLSFSTLCKIFGGSQKFWVKFHWRIGSFSVLSQVHLKCFCNKSAPPDAQRQTTKGMIEGTRHQISIHHLQMHLNFMTPDLTRPPTYSFKQETQKKMRDKKGLRFFWPWGMFVFPFCSWTMSDRAETLLTYRRFYQTSDRWVWGGAPSLPAGVYMWPCVQNRSHGWHTDHPNVADQHDSHQQTSVLEAGKEESGWGMW